MKTPSILFHRTPTWEHFDITSGEEMSLRQICNLAGWKYNISGSFEPRVFIVSTGKGHKQFSLHGQHYYLVDTKTLPIDDANNPKRWLEILAYAFFDYRAREVCRGKFGPPDSNVSFVQSKTNEYTHEIDYQSLN